MKKAVTGGLAALSLVACSNAAHTAAPTSAIEAVSPSTTAAVHSERVASFSGAGNQTTVPFVIAPAAFSWQLTWSMAGYANVVILESADGQNIAQVVNHVGRTLGHVQRQDMGTYSLVVKADGAWSVFIDQTMPGPPTAPPFVDTTTTTDRG